MDRNDALELVSKLVYQKIWEHGGCTKCYHWRPFDEIKENKQLKGKLSYQIIEEICSMKESEAEQVVRFRINVAEKWRLCLDKRAELRDLVVKLWGGMKGKRIEKFDLSDFETLRDNCSKPSMVSSISKLLAAIYPDKYFVFDSRISVFLNKLIDQHPEVDYEFVLPPGRSHYYIKYKSTRTPKKNKFEYQDYCQIFYRVRDLIESNKSLLDLDLSGARIQLLELCLYMQAH